MKRIALALAALTLSAPLYAQNVATVNGKAITQKSVDQFVSLLVTQGATDSPQLREQVKQELITREVLLQAAEKAGVAKQPEVQTELDLTRQGILVRALQADFLKKNPVTDAQVQAEYNKLKAEQGNQQEYKVRHILVEDEKLANDLTAQLTGKKAKFEDLAKKNSKDPGSAERGGELGWAPASNYVQPFAQAVTALKKGEISAKPVQTQFGWHVIQVEDARPVEFPPLDQVRPQIEEMLRQQAFTTYRNGLREKAKVQ
ncbi:Peptidyl-prolyl cis-trans isomerase [plant metagenome]|uniref:peptidylprolyl isomerase n=2 Tax=root TaxID=1 RepID=A0A1C3K3S4_9BURK|nr:peptidylprolyl isomerase [Orrella dioscoreae]SBT26159.1 Peptidyl-prolyl cis-trans isomerase [Orrella dioscoreae]SOE48341.1 Peptidyl-prolyl cis-trans isomerase [Orrella dioscoreae]